MGCCRHSSSGCCGGRTINDPPLRLGLSSRGANDARAGVPEHANDGWATSKGGRESAARAMAAAAESPASPSSTRHPLHRHPLRPHYPRPWRLPGFPEDQPTSLLPQPSPELAALLQTVSGAGFMLFTIIRRRRGMRGISRVLTACRYLLLAAPSGNAWFRSVDPTGRRLEAYTEAERGGGPSMVNTLPLLANGGILIHVGSSSSSSSLSSSGLPSKRLTPRKIVASFIDRLLPPVESNAAAAAFVRDVIACISEKEAIAEEGGRERMARRSIGVAIMNAVFEIAFPHRRQTQVPEEPIDSAVLGEASAASASAAAGGKKRPSSSSSSSSSSSARECGRCRNWRGEQYQ